SANVPVSRTAGTRISANGKPAARRFFSANVVRRRGKPCARLQTSRADGKSRAHVCKRRAQTGKVVRTPANVVRRRGKPCARLQTSRADGESRAHVCKRHAQ